jgi:alkyl sulfatase BDS1-like metallo-beta-lactamase superfamily hydrolase
MPSSRTSLLSIGLFVLGISGCAQSNERPTLPPNATDSARSGIASEPSVHTVRHNRAVAESLPLDDPQDFADARRGKIAGADQVRILSEDGRVLWDTASYDFIVGEAPASVNPSLWRQEKLNNEHGLFEVVDGIYQVRGYDLANMSVIDGATGWIIVDPLGSRETAAAAMALVREHLGNKPVRAIIYTHSHIDHFGGVEGVATIEEVKAKGIRIVAPAGIMEESISELLLAGAAMSRRASFMYGFGLERSPRGHVGSGLGKTPTAGNWTIIPPTDTVEQTGQKLVLDGVEFVFQYTPESEAPAEFLFYLPAKKVLFGAEVVSRNMHNVLTLRGAKVRDALKWSGYIDETIDLFPEAVVLVNSHHWPVWGQRNIREYLEGQRDTYKFLHDQSLNLANRGYTPNEISEAIRLPDSLAKTFANRGYYGTTSHNTRAVYQHYFGFYDGNPVNLHPHPPVAEAVRYVDAMGGPDRVLEIAAKAYAEGDYRWSARILGHLVFADPKNEKARNLLARTFDQLGYQAESGPWRDIYLTGALELREDGPSAITSTASANGILQAVPISGFLDALAVRLSADKTEGKELIFNFTFTDLGETHVVEIRNSVLNHRQGDPDPDADATITLTRAFWQELLSGQVGLQELIFSDGFAIEGSRLALVSFLTSIDTQDPNFNIVIP